MLFDDSEHAKDSGVGQNIYRFSELKSTVTDETQNCCSYLVPGEMLGAGRTWRHFLIQELWMGEMEQHNEYNWFYRLSLGMCSYDPGWGWELQAK